MITINMKSVPVLEVICGLSGQKISTTPRYLKIGCYKERKNEKGNIPFSLKIININNRYFVQGLNLSIFPLKGLAKDIASKHQSFL